MPEFTSTAETLRVVATELSHQPDVIGFMESRISEAKDRLKTNNGIPLSQAVFFTVGAWQRVGENFECDVLIHLPEKRGTLGGFHERMKGQP